MSIAAFIRDCVEIYGERWQTPLARDLDVAPRTVRRWAAGERAIPADVALSVGTIAAAIRRETAGQQRSRPADPAEWRVDGDTAIHATGLRVAFTRDGDAWDGQAVPPFPDWLSAADPKRLASLMRAAGEAFSASRK